MPRLPSTREEFIVRYNQNNVVTGEGLEEVRHLPCPFCAAADLILLRTFHVAEDLKAGGICRECGRGIRVIFIQSPRGQILQYEVVQTVGADPPSYIEPRPRRDA